MNAVEVVIGKMQSNRKPKVIELLGKGIRQACEPANRHSDRHVLTLDEASRNVAFARVSDSHLGYNLDDWAWGVPFSSVLAIVAIELHKLRIVHIKAERFLNNLGLEVEIVSGQLDLIGKPFVKVGDKGSRILDGALGNAERCDQLGFRVHRDEYALIANLTVVVVYLALLLLNERPDFIAANRASFNETSNGADRSILGGTHRIGAEVRQTLQSRNCSASVGFYACRSSEPLTGSVLASEACHGLFSACVEREKPYNEIGSGVRLTPRSGLAPQPVSAGLRGRFLLLT